MSDAKYSSSDIPNFDTYPSRSPQGTRGDLIEQVRLEEMAVQLGSSVGKIVRRLRNQREVAEKKISAVTEEATAALNQRVETVKAQADEIKRVTSNKAQELWTVAEQKAGEVREQAVRNIKQAQVRVQEIQRDYPERVAIGAGVLGIAVGVGLRIWRSNRAA